MESSIIVTVITSITIFDGTNINDSGANNKNIDDNNSTIMIKIIIAGNLTTIKMITMITKTIKMSKEEINIQRTSQTSIAISSFNQEMAFG